MPYREALTIGLNKHDQVISRRLAQKLEFLAYFDAYQARYQEPARYTFTQIFVNPDQRGDTTLDDAAAIKAT